jgi:anti-anti-sigma regulatory factor
MSPPSVVKVGRIPPGYRVRVEGRGTLRESPAVHEFAGHALRDGASTLVVDLSACDYLDSTFLGCLVDLHRRHGSGQPPRLLIAASPAVRRQAFAANHLEPLFHHVDECPEVVGEDRVIPPLALEASDLGRHILECHRRLAEVEGPNRSAFGAVVEGLARELSGSRPGPH